MCSNEGFYLECVSRYWELILRNGDRLEGLSWRGSPKGEKQPFYQDMLSVLGMGPDSEEKPQQVVCYRTGDEMDTLDMNMDMERGSWFETSLPASLAYVSLWKSCLAKFSVNAYWSLVAETKGCSQRNIWGEDRHDHQKLVPERERGSRR